MSIPALLFHVFHLLSGRANALPIYSGTYLCDLNTEIVVFNDCEPICEIKLMTGPAYNYSTSRGRFRMTPNSPLGEIFNEQNVSVGKIRLKKTNFMIQIGTYQGSCNLLSDDIQSHHLNEFQKSQGG